MGGRGGGSKSKRGGGGARTGVAVKGETANMRISEMTTDQMSKEMVRLEETKRRAEAGRSNKAGEPYAFTSSDARRLTQVTEAWNTASKRETFERKVRKYNRTMAAWNKK